jgi:hypothetical protein
MSDDQGGVGPPSEREPTRAIAVFLNVAFVVVLIGILAGASSQPWFLVFAIAWMAVGGYFLQKNRRSRPAPPKLFDDESR